MDKKITFGKFDDENYKNIYCDGIYVGYIERLANSCSCTERCGWIPGYAVQCGDNEAAGPLLGIDQEFKALTEVKAAVVAAYKEYGID